MGSNLLDKFFSLFSGGGELILLLFNPPNIISIDQQTSIVMAKIAMIVSFVIIGNIFFNRTFPGKRGSSLASTMGGTALGLLLSLGIPDKTCLFIGMLYFITFRAMEGLVFGLGLTLTFRKYKIPFVIVAAMLLVAWSFYRDRLSFLSENTAVFPVILLVALAGMVHTCRKIGLFEQDNAMGKGIALAFIIMASVGMLVAPQWDSAFGAASTAVFPLASVLGGLVGMRARLVRS